MLKTIKLSNTKYINYIWHTISNAHLYVKHQLKRNIYVRVQGRRQKIFQGGNGKKAKN